MGLMQDNEARYDDGYTLPVKDPQARQVVAVGSTEESGFPPNHFGPANFWTDPSGLYDTASMFVLPFFAVWVLTFVLIFTSHSVPALKLPLTIAIAAGAVACLTWRQIGKHRNARMVKAKESELAAADEANRLF